jgi:hypothetical protein
MKLQLRPLAPLFAFALACSLAGSLAAEALAGDGELWEVSSAMSMQGFALPPQTRRECTAKGSRDAATRGGDPSCKVSDLSVNGNKTTWRVECSEPPHMKGVGEITYNGDGYSGTLRFTSDDGEMTMKLSGKRVGACKLGR